MRSQQEMFLHECPFIVSLISEQFVNNSCSIRVPGNNSCSKQNQFVPPKNESRLDEAIHEHSWREKRKVCAEKTNNFVRFFVDSTLTFLTYGNTFRLVILPTRRVIFLCLPLI